LGRADLCRGRIDRLGPAVAERFSSCDLAPERTMVAASQSHCVVDDWSYDARYTRGRCPICGAEASDIQPNAQPTWLATLSRVNWDLAALAVLGIILLITGAVVWKTAGFRVLP
jgi:hypothetical protein